MLNSGRILTVFSFCLLLSACMGDRPVETQEDETKYLVIETQTVSAARCEVKDEEAGSWTVGATPQKIDVTLARGALDISCYKSGYQPTTLNVKSYLDRVVVWMEPATWGSKQQMDVWNEAKEAYENSNRK